MDFRKEVGDLIRQSVINKSQPSLSRPEMLMEPSMGGRRVKMAANRARKTPGRQPMSGRRRGGCGPCDPEFLASVIRASTQTEGGLSLGDFSLTNNAMKLANKLSEMSTRDALKYVPVTGDILKLYDYYNPEGGLSLGGKGKRCVKPKKKVLPKCVEPRKKPAPKKRALPECVEPRRRKAAAKKKSGTPTQLIPYVMASKVLKNRGLDRQEFNHNKKILAQAYDPSLSKKQNMEIMQAIANESCNFSVLQREEPSVYDEPSVYEELPSYQSLYPEEDTESEEEQVYEYDTESEEEQLLPIYEDPARPSEGLMLYPDIAELFPQYSGSGKKCKERALSSYKKAELQRMLKKLTGIQLSESKSLTKKQLMSVLNKIIKNRTKPKPKKKKKAVRRC